MTIVDETPQDRRTRAKWGKRLEKLGHLYRYRSLDKFERIEQVVVQSEMFFPGFPALNDPFDGRVQLDYRASPERIRSFWEAHLAETGRPIDDTERARTKQFVDGRDDPQVHAQLRAIATAATEVLGVVCFSEPKDDIPMWAYYADSQKGVCLRFRADVLVRNSLAPLRVSYVKDYPKVGFYADSRFRRTQALVATKAKSWKHEREWRVLQNEGGRTYAFDPAALDGIIMGCSVSDEDKARVRALVSRRRPRIELLQARPTERAFGLDIGPST